MQMQVWSLGREDPQQEEVTTHFSQYSCLENPMDGGAWRAIVHGVAKLDMNEHMHGHKLETESVFYVCRLVPLYFSPELVC